MGAVAEDGYRHLENVPVVLLSEEEHRQAEKDPVVVPSSVIPAESSGTGTQPSDDLPQSDDSSSCSTPTDDLQMSLGLLDTPWKQIASYMQSLSETDKSTSIKRHRGNN